MKILITGGHLSPALSVIKSFSKDTDILFVGRKYTFEGDKSLSFEYKTAEKLKIPFKAITAGRLQRKFTFYTIPSLLKFPIGIFQAFLIINKYKPDIILSFGGYVSLPVVIAGYFKKIPIVIHEQTLSLGLANKIASFFATKVCVSWEKSLKYFPKNKTVFTGLPLKEFNTESVEFNFPKNNLPVIFVTGGSAGSHFINVLVEGCLEKLLNKFNIVHQTGDNFDFKDFERLSKIKNNFSEELKNRYILTKFIDAKEIGTIFKKAKLVICRSGINTVSELIYFEKPAVLIPINSEQKENAIFLNRLGLAEVLDQNNTYSEKLYSVIIDMVNKAYDFQPHKNFLVKDSAERIKKVVYSLVKL